MFRVCFPTLNLFCLTLLTYFAFLVVFASRIPPRPLEDQGPCGKVLLSFSFGPQEGSTITPETMHKAEKEARDGTQKWTKGNLEEVTSPILRGALLRLRRFFAVGNRPAQPFSRQVSEVIRSGSGLA